MSRSIPGETWNRFFVVVVAMTRFVQFTLKCAYEKYFVWVSRVVFLYDNVSRRSPFPPLLRAHVGHDRGREGWQGCVLISYTGNVQCTTAVQTLKKL